MPARRSIRFPLAMIAVFAALMQLLLLVELRAEQLSIGAAAGAVDENPDETLQVLQHFLAEVGSSPSAVFEAR
jgi:hypothetical protein